ncbi:MAG: hypothetical protein JSS20_02810 [Proteobacteria bacterium]|nr:hypothetical protein [Pseudomonadota bacterium]
MRTLLGALALAGMIGGAALAEEPAPKSAQSPGAVVSGFGVPGRWVNDRGSELAITYVEANGSFRGEYLNKAPGFGCRNSPFDVSGRIDGDHVRFVVLWKNASESCNSMTAWAGKLEGAKLATEWELARVDAKTGGLGIFKGSSVFTRQK